MRKLKKRKSKKDNLIKKKILEDIRNGMSLENIVFQDEEICTEAIRKDYDNFKFVERQTKKICMLAIKKNAYNLKYVREQDREICLAAVKQNGFSIQFIEEKYLDIDLCMIAIQNSYIYQIDEELSLNSTQRLIRQFERKGFVYSFIKSEKFKKRLYYMIDQELI